MHNYTKQGKYPQKLKLRVHKKSPSRSLHAHTVGERSSQYAGYVSQRISSWSCAQCGRNQAQYRPTAPAADSFAHKSLGHSESNWAQSLVHLGSGTGRILSRSSHRPSFIHQSSSERTFCLSGILSKQVRKLGSIRSLKHARM